MRSKSINTSVQKWGNSLALRIPASLANALHVHLGSEVELTVIKGAIVIKPTGSKKMTLRQRLKLYDPKKHGGEVFADDLLGKERFDE